MTTEDYRIQLESKYGDRRKADFEKEWPTVKSYFETVKEKLTETYSIDKVLAVGGTGIVHTGKHNRFHQPIVLKFNRPNVEVELVSMVENESRILPTFNHPNIVRVLDLGEMSNFTPKLNYIVEPFITGSTSLFNFDPDKAKETWLYSQLDVLKQSMPGNAGHGGNEDLGQVVHLVSDLLSNIAAIFAQWTSALYHIHDSGYVYLDVKPENVLVDQHLHVTSIDFGSVERLDSDDQSSIDIFYTERYAHPKLIERKKEKPSSNRVRGGFKRAELKNAFDHFALGMSFLEVLNEIARVRPHVVPQVPLYRSLHFLATRLLDGENTAKSDQDHYEFASQVFPSLEFSDYTNLSYEHLSDAYQDLEKERGHWNLESKIPELAAYSKDIVRVVPGFNTVLTSRLKRVIEHPLVARLKYVTQLGLVSLVYPTADHSRYDHALGSYTYTTYYVKSLFNDLGNPLFRNLVSAEDINAVLLAALLHDLGQYPLAHDLEEVHERIFKHALIGRDLLEDTTQDSHGRSLLDIIQNPQNGWGVNPDALRRILGAHSRNKDLLQSGEKPSLKTNVLAAIVDGQVDADKADYIIRDSARCELPYGSQLDIERLLRVLTVAINPEETSSDKRVSLGVYDKGLISAHAFGQARYELLATVYWHHTTRVAKAMLQYATVQGLPREVYGPKGDNRDRVEQQIREQLLALIKSLVPPFEVNQEEDQRRPQITHGFDLSTKPSSVVSGTIIENDDLSETSPQINPRVSWYPGVAWTDLLMMEWLKRLPNANEQSRNLIDGIQNRRLYKRVVTFTRGGSQHAIIEKLDSLSWTDRIDLCRKLHTQVVARLNRDWTNLNTTTPMVKTDFEKLCDSHLLILVDIPDPSKKIGYDRPLGVVPELREKSYHQDKRQAVEDKTWRDIMTKMNTQIAPVRILCHPDLRNIVTSVYASQKESIESSMATLIENALRGQ